MSNTILRNENVSVTLKSLGGELTSIKDAHQAPCVRKKQRESREKVWRSS